MNIDKIDIDIMDTFNENAEESDEIIANLRNFIKEMNPNIYLPELFSLKCRDKTFDIWLNVRYYANKNLSIHMVEFNGDIPIGTWGVLTYDSDFLCAKDCAYIDIYNIGVEILEFINENELAVFTGIVRDGYPEYRFHPEVLSNIDPYGYGRYLVNFGKEISPIVY